MVRRFAQPEMVTERPMPVATVTICQGIFVFFAWEPIDIGVITIYDYFAFLGVMTIYDSWNIFRA